VIFGVDQVSLGVAKGSSLGFTETIWALSDSSPDNRRIKADFVLAKASVMALSVQVMTALPELVQKGQVKNAGDELKRFERTLFTRVLPSAQLFLVSPV
jgi:hypothetical protein